MIPAIGASASTPSFSTGGAALQGQLARYEKELSACVNCSTANTTEGKQKIQLISSQIEQIKARIEQATQARGILRVENRTSFGVSGLDSVLKTESATYDPGSDARPRIGRLIDVEA